jgi:hypothetical protein
MLLCFTMSWHGVRRTKQSIQNGSKLQGAHLWERELQIE